MSNNYQNTHTLSIPKRSREKRAEKAIIFLYLFFFLLWSCGYSLGIMESNTLIVAGLPFWFFLSCIFAFLLTTFTLYIIIKSLFQ